MKKLPHTDPREMVETAFLASTTAMLFLVNYYFPLGPLLRMLFPLPTALAYLRWNSRAAWMAMVVTSLLLAILMGPTRSIQYIVPHGLVGVTLGYLWKRDFPWSGSLSIATIIGSVGTAFQFVFLSVLLGENVWTYSIVQISAFLNWLMQLFGSLEQPDFAMIQAFAIGSILISNLAYQLLVHLVAWIVLDRIGNPIPHPPKWLESLLA
ncbi:MULTISPECIES: DUF2232 domain-containing protein [Pseudanabaena]|uniref:DUF2232 domain-containing protein n=2 Tax=Pseudanabaena TaxID=1152 RepID=L8N0D6_9CYAN|nr:MULTISPECIES: DUF2232 domain-containing protein [Pseudanabaena]ELS31713.1 Protein of unknown function DUF2232, membrane [Pseudanabaena biceps PCC 7429]MDG3496021.1 DUF2232 domain-containing protein [Pseudanabaena catenata USMAC16]